MRSMLTHWAGVGSRAGLLQTNCWQMLRSPPSAMAIRDWSGKSDMVGLPGSQAFPISTTSEPSSVRRSASRGASFWSQARYSSPSLLPYFFFRLSGNGGEKNTSCTLPLSFLPWRSRKSSTLPRNTAPSSVS